MVRTGKPSPTQCPCGAGRGLDAVLSSGIVVSLSRLADCVFVISFSGIFVQDP
jgi:hypothetical protein